ncbi:HNH endonuclease, partial [Cytobacillus praedii]
SPTHGIFKSAIDLEDVDKVKNIKWSVSKYGNQYDVFYLINPNREGLLHRFIMGSPEGKHIDHIDGNTLNNRKSNLRACEHRENLRNTKMYSTNKSGHRGVTLHKKSGKWWAYIMVNYKHKSLGYYYDIEDAIKARKAAEEKYFGEFKSAR